MSSSRGVERSGAAPGLAPSPSTFLSRRRLRSIPRIFIVGLGLLAGAPAIATQQPPDTTGAATATGASPSGGPGVMAQAGAATRQASRAKGTLSAAPTNQAQGDDLAPSWQEPWNPPHPMGSGRLWETALRAPGRILSLPLAALGLVTERGLLRFERTSWYAQLVAGNTSAPGRGPVRPRLGGLGDRTGFGGSIALTRPVFSGQLAQHAQILVAGTTRGYNATRLSLTGHPAALEYGYDWRPKDWFYGLGPGTVRADRTDYSLQSESLRLGTSFGWSKEKDSPTPHTMVNAWVGPRSLVIARGREPGTPSVQEIFPGLPAADLGLRREHLLYGLQFTNDWRAGRPHWGSGWRVLLGAERFDRPPRQLELHGIDVPGGQFTRFTLETETGRSFGRDPRTLRLLARLVDLEVTGDGDHIPISDLSLLGGRAGLGGFDPGRFRDHDLALGRLMWVFPLQRELEAEIHGELGQVSPEIWRDFRVDRLEHSFGFAFRPRFGKPLGSFGMDFSREAVRFRFAFGGVE